MDSPRARRTRAPFRRLRFLRRTPGLWTALLLMLALGAGISIPLLSLAEAGLVHPSPLDAPQGLELPVRDAGLHESSVPAVRAEGGGPLLWGGSASGRHAGPRSIEETQRAGLRTLLWTLAGAAAFTLLIACSSLALLLLSRATARRHEVAMRAVLGATGRRLAARFVVEGALLASVGLLAGVLLAQAGITLLREGWPEGLARWLGPAPEPGAAAAVLVVLGGSTLLVSLAPARGLRAGLLPAISSGGRTTPGPRERIARGRLGVAATAVAVVLLVGAGQLLRGFGTAQAGQHPGFDPRDTLTLELAPPSGALADPGRRAAYLADVLREVDALPGVRAVSVASQGAWMGLGSTGLVHALTGNPVRPGILRPTRFAAVSPGYFAALGVPIRRGREFTPADDAGGAPVVVVSETFAHRFFPRVDPLGKYVQPGRLALGGVWYTVVGVVGEVRPRGIGSPAQPEPVLYLSALQVPPAGAGLAVRVAGTDPMDAVPALQRALRRAGPAPVVTRVSTMEEQLARFRAPLGWLAGVFGALAGLAVLLAALGLFGVISFNVARRTREIGVRAALGAAPRRLVAMVVRQGVGVAALGVALGLAGAICLGRLLQFFFAGVNPLDPLVLGSVAALLFAVAVLASFLPARTAARTDPALALRAE